MFFLTTIRVNHEFPITVNVGELVSRPHVKTLSPTLSAFHVPRDSYPPIPPPGFVYSPVKHANRLLRCLRLSLGYRTHWSGT